MIGSVVEHEELDRQAARAAVESSIADIRKQPSPVIETTLPVRPNPLGPDGGRNRPAHALVVRGGEVARGPCTEIASEAQWVDAVTSTKINSSGPSAARSWVRKYIGSTPQVILGKEFSRWSTCAHVLNFFQERRAGGRWTEAHPQEVGRRRPGNLRTVSHR